VSGPVAIDPDSLDAEAPRRRDVVEPAAGGMDPIVSLDTGLLLESLDIAETWFVAPNHLRGDHKIWPQRELRERLGEEIVIAIREHGELPAGPAQCAERRGHVPIERQLAPLAHDHVRLPLGQGQADLPRALLQARRQDVPIESVRALRLDRALELVIGADELVGAISGDR